MVASDRKTSHPSAVLGRRGGGRGGTRAIRVPPDVQIENLDPTTFLLRPKEVAQMLGISRSKVFELLGTRELPAVRIGRAVRVPKPQLQAWINGQVEWDPRQQSGLLGRLRGANPSGR
jgi:excisionase family DNA binding protein